MRKHIFATVLQLKKTKAISKFIAVVLMLLLMLSITPKLFLHEILANHKDSTSCTDVTPGTPCIHKQGFNCEQSEVVVPNAYLVSEPQPEILHHGLFVSIKFEFTSTLTKNVITLSHERAPPVCV